MVIWTVDGDGGRRDRVDLFSIFERHIYNRTRRSSILGGASRMAPKYLGYAACGVLLSWKQKKIGGREAINLIRDITSKWRCQ